ncbi:hypothetical protein [Nostoc sp. PCC 9305]|uniref:hypothetical protein n=1 Tax=Nostoc sp. PCC 9305 TaxID=296636 RepID=UPI0039C6C95A
MQNSEFQIKIENDSFSIKNLDLVNFSAIWLFPKFLRAASAPNIPNYHSFESQGRGSYRCTQLERSQPPKD